METEPDRKPEATPLVLALDGFGTALDHLVKLVDDGALDELDAPELIEFLQAFEHIRNRMAVVDHRAIDGALARDVPHTLCRRSMTQVLMEALRLSAGEAARRVKSAEHLSDRLSMTGEPLEPWRPGLAAAQRRGDVTPEQVSVIDKALRRVDGAGFDPADVHTGEQILVEAALMVGPKELEQLATKVVEAIDPDGTVPDEQLQQDRRYLTLRRHADGSFRGEFRLTPEVGAKLRAILTPLAVPRVSRLDLAANCDSAAPGQGAVLDDPRSYGQRLHDALHMACDRILRSDGVPESGGVPASVLITIDADNLRTRSGTGRLSDGSQISAETVIELADQAELAWCVKDSRGAVLTLGRSRRIASRAQSLALAARDGGCSFPGCDTAPEWCERHHVIGWVDGGRTDRDNLTLLCRYHHHNFAGRGWTCRMNRHGLPEWTPPLWIDRHRRGVVNHRIQIANWHPRESGATPDPP